MHEILNPDGVLIRVPAWTVGRLRQLGLVDYDRESRRSRVSPRYFDLLPLLRSRSTPPRPLRASDPARNASSGSSLYSVLGPDCSGPSEAVCHCRECESEREDADGTASPFEGRKVQRRS